MENIAAEKAVILIPSLEPDDRLPAYIRKLKEGGFAHIVVVDDGSSDSFRPVFEEAAAVNDTVVLRHEVNQGKGVALKTGYRYIMDHLDDITGVITADADGQHTVEDCLKLAEELEKGEGLSIWEAGISILNSFRPKAAPATRLRPPSSGFYTENIFRTRRPDCGPSGKKSFPS
jgi:Glycosyltransferases involved in cell wall biogenesis